MCSEVFCPRVPFTLNAFVNVFCQLSYTKSQNVRYALPKVDPEQPLN